MVERLGLGPEVRELKLGPSFTSNSTKFHTLKYDFKPASVDDSKEARVDVGSDNTVTVTVPHLDGAGTPHTVFKGSQRPYNKEYVLILDKITGEITLEKLTANVQVKKTRAEPKRNSNSNTSMPVEVKRSPTYGRANGRTKVISGKKKEPLLQLHPKQSSPRRSPSSPVQSSSGQPTLASLPMIGSDNDDFGLSTSLMPGSSSSQDLASQSIPMSNTKSTTLESDSSSSSSSSDSSSSDYETENVSVPTINSNLNNTNVSSTLFMSDNLLNDDLQLSESESD
ncbi:ell-associated factor Eaf isoform X2 [Monomorium pharaonis]|uniref:ell-associated factor Eaf isoform X2 n=1 Tax=Monomorium pharaonis TaxID=307658 RepID=UPI00063FCC00|nr:ell-associated factor Eaf isoform X2 [Monomorium pharaonis]